MRDPKRIKRVLDELEFLWTKHPGLHLGQIVSNASNGRDPFFIEDLELIDNIGFQFNGPIGKE